MSAEASQSSDIESGTQPAIESVRSRGQRMGQVVQPQHIVIDNINGSLQDLYHESKRQTLATNFINGSLKILIYNIGCGMIFRMIGLLFVVIAFNAFSVSLFNVISNGAINIASSIDNKHVTCNCSCNQ